MNQKRKYWLTLNDGVTYQIERPLISSVDLDLQGFVAEIQKRTGIQIGSLWIPWHAIVRIQIQTSLTA